jgi:hypothetical protein
VVAFYHQQPCCRRRRYGTSATACPGNRKLGSTQTTFHKLQKSHLNQTGLIDKECHEAETLVLREEMQMIRQELEFFRQNLPKQPTPPVQRHQPPREYSAPTLPTAIRTPRKSQESPPRMEATNYWKREWALSMQEMRDEATPDQSTANGRIKWINPARRDFRLFPV